MAAPIGRGGASPSFRADPSTGANTECTSDGFWSSHPSKLVEDVGGMRHVF